MTYEHSTAKRPSIDDGYSFDSFVSDDVVTVRTVATLDRHAELASFVSSRESSREARFKRGVDTLPRHCSFVAFVRTVERCNYERPQDLNVWRNARSAVSRLHGCTLDVEALQRACVDDVVTLDDGTTLTLDTRTLDRERRNALARLIDARRVARRYRRVTLRGNYWGSLTGDGMSLNGTTTANRLAPLDRALALSDTYVTRQGVTTAHKARAVVRYDNGFVSPLDTINAARTRHNARKGRS